MSAALSRPVSLALQAYAAETPRPIRYRFGGELFEYDTSVGALRVAPPDGLEPEDDAGRAPPGPAARAPANRAPANRGR